MRRAVIICLFLWISPAFATISDRDLNISGNTKTRSAYIKKLFLECYQHLSSQPPATNELTYLQQCLLNARIFSEVKINKVDNKYSINVKDKWTIIPIPILKSSSGNEREVGAFIFDSNFLGMATFFAVLASFSRQGNQYALIYEDSSLFFTNYYLAAAVEKSRFNLHLQEKDQITDGFTEHKTGQQLSFGRKFDHITPKINFYRDSLNFSLLEQYTPPQDNDRTRMGIGIELDYSDYKFYFNEGLKLRTDYDIDTQRSDDFKHSKTFQLLGNYNFSMMRDHALLTQLWIGIVEDGNTQDALRLGYKRGIRGTSSKSIWAERFYSLATGYLIPFRSYPSGIFAAGPFFDYGYVKNRGGTNSEILFHAYGVGTYYFLKRIAIEGLGLEVGHNNQYEKFFVQFYLGFSMK